MELQLSQNFIDTLKNCVNINTNLVFREGNVIRTISNSKQTFAEFNIDVNIPKSFALLDISKFLSIISLYKDNIKCELYDEYMKLVGNNEFEINLLYTDERFLKDSSAAADKIVTWDASEELFSITLEKTVLESIMKVSNILGLPHLKVFSQDGDIFITVFDEQKDQSTNKMTKNVGKLTKNVIFEYHFNIENFKMLMDDYNFILTSTKRMAIFKNSDKQYIVAPTQAKVR